MLNRTDAYIEERFLDYVSRRFAQNLKARDTPLGMTTSRPRGKRMARLRPGGDADGKTEGQRASVSGRNTLCGLEHFRGAPVLLLARIGFRSL